MIAGAGTDDRSPGAVVVCPVLIGRAAELTHLLRRWHAARDGAGQFVLLSGEAGIGKTRLIAELIAAAHADRQLTAAVFARDAESTGALVLALCDALRAGSWPGSAASGERLRAQLLGIRDQSDPARTRRLLTGDLADTIVQLLGEAPTLLVIEDLHWADELSLEVLERVAITVARTPTMIVASFRNDELYPRTPLRSWRAQMLGTRRAEELHLHRLTAESTAAMIEAIRESMPPAEYAAAVQNRSDGIPLHIEELIASGSRLSVPDTVADAVLARVAALSPTAQQLVRAAAVIGRSFDLDLLTELDAAPPDDVDRALGELTSTHLVVDRDGDSTYDFRHALIRDAIYESIAPLRRRQLHAAAARAAISAGLPDAAVSDHFERAHLPAEAYRYALTAAADASRLSAHREAAELLRRAQRTAPNGTPQAERATLHARLAGELAAADQNEAAANQLQQAIALRRRLGDERGAADLVPRLMAARHLLGDGLDARVALADDALARLARADAHADADADADADVSVDAALPRPSGADVTFSRPRTTDADADAHAGADAHSGVPDAERSRGIRSRLYAALSAAHMLDRRLDESLDLGRQAAELADRSDPAVAAELIDIDLTLGSVMVFAGRSAEGWNLLENAVAASEGAGNEPQAARAYRMIGSCASVLVEYDRAERYIARGLDYTARTERWNDHHYLRAHLANTLWAIGELGPAQTAARQALADGGDGITTRITALIVLGYVALSTGELDGAATHLDEARALGEQMNELQRLSPALWGLAELAFRRGDRQQCIRLCERGLAASAEVDDAAYLFPFVVTATRAMLGGALAAPGTPAPGDGSASEGAKGGSAGAGTADDRADTGAADAATAAAARWLEAAEGLLRFRAIAGTLPALAHAHGLVLLASGAPQDALPLLDRAHSAWRASRRAWEGDQAAADLERCRAAVAAGNATVAGAAGAAGASGAGTGAAGAAAGSAGGAGAGGTGAAGRAAQAGHPHPQRPLLTGREREVAERVARGATNREIAAELSISAKTVSTHVEHILTKLGAARRAEIAAWVVRDGDRR